MNRPAKVVADSVSDPNLKQLGNSGMFSGFQNRFTTPLLNVKGMQLNRMNFVNPLLQLNDSAHLMFFYYRGTAAGGAGAVCSAANLRCVRLVPSWYVPTINSYTTFTKNKYFNSVSELVAALNTAAATGGDDTNYNPKWVAGDVTFSYDSSTRKISLTGNTASNLYALAAADDPNVTAYLATNAIKLNTSAGQVVQPYTINQSMNARLGWGMSYTNRGKLVNAGTVTGTATTTGIPTATSTAIEADSYPILIGSQNINIYCAQALTSGNDSGYRKNLLATIPLDQPSLAVNNYTLPPVPHPAQSVISEMYQLDFEFRDDFGNPIFFYPNTNVQLELNLWY